MSTGPTGKPKWKIKQGIGKVNQSRAEKKKEKRGGGINKINKIVCKKYSFSVLIIYSPAKLNVMMIKSSVLDLFFF